MDEVIAKGVNEAFAKQKFSYKAYVDYLEEHPFAMFSHVTNLL
jgi:hypothetical protein